MAQFEDRLLQTPDVRGSNPVISPFKTKLKPFNSLKTCNRSSADDLIECAPCEIFIHSFPIMIVVVDLNCLYQKSKVNKTFERVTFKEIGSVLKKHSHHFEHFGQNAANIFTVPTKHHIFYYKAPLAPQMAFTGLTNAHGPSLQPTANTSEPTRDQFWRS